MSEELACEERGRTDFGWAVRNLKTGKKVARSGWNGKGMFLYYVPANSYPATTKIAKDYWRNRQAADGVHADEDILVPYGAYIAMKTAQDNVVPWLASQPDVLADDWELVA